MSLVLDYVVINRDYVVTSDNLFELPV